MDIAPQEGLFERCVQFVGEDDKCAHCQERLLVIVDDEFKMYHDIFVMLFRIVISKKFGFVHVGARERERETEAENNAFVREV